MIEVIQGDLFINTSLKNVNSAKKVEADPVNSLLYSIQEEVKAKLSNTSFKDLKDASAE